MFVTFYSSFVNLDLYEDMIKIIEFCAQQQSAQNSKVYEELIASDMIYSKKSKWSHLSLCQRQEIKA